MATDSSADEQGPANRAADAVEQASDARSLDLRVRLGFATLRAVSRRL
ncbi:hypothetical protein [Arthrobacter antioxidans]|nr:hypothetical protein [Arthrobacter antioxidans]